MAYQEKINKSSEGIPKRGRLILAGLLGKSTLESSQSIEMTRTEINSRLGDIESHLEMLYTELDALNQPESNEAELYREEISMCIQFRDKLMNMLDQAA